MYEGDFNAVMEQLGEETKDDFSHELLFTKDSDSPKRYRVKTENLGNLMLSYCMAYQNMESNLALAERSSNIMPLIIQLHLKFGHNTADPYDDDFGRAFIYTTQRVIRRYLDIEDHDEILYCCQLETQLQKNDDCESMYVRFQFPNCRCETELVVKTMIPTLIRELGQDRVSTKFSTEPLNMSWISLIDQSVYNNSVPMLGSCQRENEEPFLFVQGYGIIQEDDGDMIDVDQRDAEILDIAEIFNLKSHGYVNSGVMGRKFFTQDRDLNFWLPFVLSINYGHKTVMSKRRSSRSPQSMERTKKKYTLSDFGKDENVEDLDKLAMAKTLLSMWKPETVLMYNNWCQIGHALFDADDAGEQGLEFWIEITIKALDAMGNPDVDFLEQGVELACSDMYPTFDIDNRTIRTLAEVAKMDNLAAYEAWHKSWCRPALELAARTGLDNDLAQAFYRCYWLDAICCYAGKRVIWYVFDKHILRENPNAHILRNRISKDFYRRFVDLLCDVTQAMQQNHNQDDRNQEKGRKIITAINKTMERLKAGPCKGRIINEAAEYFVQDNLEDLLDNNPEIMGLKNCVLVATKHGITVRGGRIEDYVSRRAGVSFNKNLHWGHKDVQAVIKWINQTFPFPELARQWRKKLASVLRGGNIDKQFDVITGEGDNSKSAWIRVLEQVLGPYCIKFPIAMITSGGHDANGPSPALARSKATRICILEEPDEGVEIKGNIIKHLTGSDSFFARFLKKNGGDIKPMFKLFLICNDIPVIPGGGKAVRNRMAITPCLSVWCHDAPEDEAEQMAQRRFKVNEMFDDDIPRLAPALLWIMIQDYPMYLKEGVRRVPKIVKDYTEKYWEETDIYHQFIADNIVRVNDEDGELDDEARVDINAMQARFKSWMRAAYPNLPTRKYPNRPKLRSEITKRIPTYEDGSWGGIALRVNIQNGNDDDLYNI